MTKDDIRKIMDEHPLLNEFGIGTYEPQRQTPAQRAAELADGRARLLESEDACTKCCEWLSRIERTKSAKKGRGSYGLKHVAEPEIGYVTNGAFIAAAIHCGFPYKMMPHSPNVLFAMSKRSVEAARRLSSQCAPAEN